MKKSSLFLLLVVFFISIFIVSSLGTKTNSDQMKHYFQSVKIINCEELDDGNGHILKYIEVDFDQQTGDPYVYIDYELNPDPSDVTEQDAYEFVFASEVPTFDYEDPITHEIKSQPYCSIYKNVVTFYHECAITVTLQTTDGSRLSDSVLIICSEPAIE